MREKGLVVSDSTVLIALSSLGVLEILKNLYGRIIIPEAVYKELVRGEGKPGSEIGSIDWIDVRTLAPQFKKYLEFDLDEGEAETIALSEEIGADLILIDDYWARKIAEYKSLKYTGTLGILLKAKKKGLIKEIKSILNELINKGFWISTELCNAVLKEAGELEV
jgi:predicted nucleic acid-binding protein